MDRRTVFPGPRGKHASDDDRFHRDIAFWPATASATLHRHDRTSRCLNALRSPPTSEHEGWLGQIAQGDSPGRARAGSAGLSLADLAAFSSGADGQRGGHDGGWTGVFGTAECGPAGKSHFLRRSHGRGALLGPG
jgi:hypothetical protein